MKTLFVMIKCDMGRTYEVAEFLADEVKEVRSVHSTSGNYDLLAQFSLGPETETGRFVTGTVQTVPGVKDTNTIIGLNAFTVDQDKKDTDEL